MATALVGNKLGKLTALGTVQELLGTSLLTLDLVAKQLPCIGC